MLFGNNFDPVSQLIGLFDSYPIGTRLQIGVDASFWIGNFGGIQDGVALLTNAQLFANPGKAIDGIRPVARIPIRLITFVSPGAPISQDYLEQEIGSEQAQGDEKDVFELKFKLLDLLIRKR